MNEHQAWLETASTQELAEAALWYQEDARTQYAWAARYRDTPGKEWLAPRVQESAACSAALGRLAVERMGQGAA